MSDLDQLAAFFERFPGVGTRQARRFAHHVLQLPTSDAEAFTKLITSARALTAECTSCRRFFSRPPQSTDTICSICQQDSRDRGLLLVVATDSDLLAIERSGTYQGLYYVLGGTLPLLSEQEAQRLRINGLREAVKLRSQQDGLREIILGFPVNPDGENTARYVQSKLVDIVDATSTITQLGRGLSTGSELEYADSETIKNALSNRTTQP